MRKFYYMISRIPTLFCILALIASCGKPSDFFNALNNQGSLGISSARVTEVTSLQQNGRYSDGDNIYIVVKFSESVTVNGNAELILELDGKEVSAPLVSGNDSAELTFLYSVGSSDDTSLLKYKAAGLKIADDAVIRDRSGLDVPTLLPLPGTSGSLSYNRLLSINNTNPFVKKITSSTADGLYGIGQTISIKAHFSKDLDHSGTASTLQLETGASDRMASFSMIENANVMVFNYTIQAGDFSSDLSHLSSSSFALNGDTLNRDGSLDSALLIIPDVGSDFSLSTLHALVIDGIRPSVVLSTSATNPFTTSNIQVTATFSEPVTGVGAGDFSIANGNISNLVTSNNQVYTFDLTPVSTGAITVDFAQNLANDAAGNGNTAAVQLTTAYSGTTPLVTLSSAAAAVTNSSPFSVTATFSEVMSGLLVSEITIGNGTASNLATGDNITFTFDVTPSGDGAVTAQIPAGVAENAGMIGNNASNILSRIYDGTPPTDNTANLQFTAAYDGDGDDIAVTWTAFTDANLSDHRLITYTNGACSTGAVDHGLTGATSNSNSTIIDGLADGTYYGRVTAVDSAGNTTQSVCSMDSILVDSAGPTDNTANLQFTDAYDADGDDVAVTWTAFTDANLSDHRLFTYTNAACSTGAVDHGLTGATTNSNSTIIDGLADGTYYGRVTAVDSAGNTTQSVCSTDSILVDSAGPTDNTANLQFTDVYDADGNDVAVTWTAFTDANLSDHRLFTYTNAACSTGAVDHGLTGATTNSNSTIIDGLADGTYYGRVTAVDSAGNTTQSVCSTDSILVDSAGPTDNTANLQFTDATDSDGHNIAVTWTAFTDPNLSDHRLFTYANAACSTGEVDHGLTGSSTNSNSTIIDGLTSGTFYGKVVAYDSAGNSTESLCSSDSINISIGPPSFNGTINKLVEADDGTNDIYAVGAFSTVNGSSYNRIVRLNSNLSIDTAFSVGTGFNNEVWEIAPVGDGSGDIYVGGQFTSYNGTSRSGFIRLNPDGTVDGTPSLGSGFTDVGGVYVLAILPDRDGSGDVYVGGKFERYKGSNYGGIIKLFANGNVDTSFSSGGGLSGGWINDLAYSATSNDRIYVGGNFGNSSVNYRGEEIGSIIAIGSDSLRDTSFNVGSAGANSYTQGITVSRDGSDEVWAAGGFTTFNGTTVTRLMKAQSNGSLNSTWNSRGFNGGVSKKVLETIDGQYILVVGEFTSVVAGSTTTSHRIARFTPSGNRSTGGWFNPSNGYNGAANSIIQLNDGTGRILIGGAFTSYNGSSASRFHVIDTLSSGTIPIITGVDSSNGDRFAGTAYKSGDSIPIEITFDQNITLAGGSARLMLGMNSGSQEALCSSTTSATLNCVYTVGASDEVSYLNYISTHALYLPSGVTLRASASPNNYASLDLPALASANSLSGTRRIDINRGPIDNTASLQFTNTTDTDGNNVAVSWTAFTDTDLANHRLFTYTNSSCGTGEVDHGLTGATTNSNSTIIDGLADGTYYGRVAAIDSAGNTTLSACSTDSLIVNLGAPVDNSANLQFTDASDVDGNDIAVTWTAFTDANLSDHRLHTYTNSACSAGEVDHGLTGSTANSNSTIIDGLAAGTYYGRVTAIDSLGNTTQSVCSTDSVTIGSNEAPTIFLNGNSIVRIAQGGTYTELGAKVFDDTDAVASATVGGATVDTATLGTYVVTYDATDSESAPATQVTRTVEVVSGGSITASTFEEILTFPSQRYENLVGAALYLPSEYFDTTQKLPILIALHGVGEAAAGSTSSFDFNTLDNTGLVQDLRGGMDIPFMVFAPQAGGNFSTTSAIDSLKDFLDYVLKHYPRADEKRIYITGLSNGGMATWHLTSKAPDTIASIVPIASFDSSINDPLIRSNIERIPIFAAHGDADGTADIDSGLGSTVGGTRSIINWINAGAPDFTPKFIVYSGAGHNTWDRVYDGSGLTSETPNNIYDWFMLNSRTQIDWNKTFNFSSAPTVAATYETKIKVDATLNLVGTIYWAAYTSAGPRSASDIINGVGAVSSGKSSGVGGVEHNILVDGLSANTSYEVWMIGESAGDEHTGAPVQISTATLQDNGFSKEAKVNCHRTGSATTGLDSSWINLDEEDLPASLGATSWTLDEVRAPGNTTSDFGINTDGTYPASVNKTFWRRNTSGRYHFELKFSGLDADKLYSIDAIGADVRAAGYNQVYIIENQSFTFDAHNNLTGLTTFSEILPRPDGTITIKIYEETDNFGAILNAIHIKEHDFN